MTKKYSIFLTIVILSAYTGQLWCQLECMDEANQPVDWFIAMKYPKSFNFVYLTPGSSQWKTSQSNLSNKTNMIALTLRQSYNQQYLYFYYNDENPQKDPKYSERGHLKGIVNFGQTSGYWLIHSVPKFPYEGQYKYNEGESVYAQSFICVTLATSNLASIVDQLLMMQSTVYSSNIPFKFSQDTTLMSNLNNLVKNKNIRAPKSRTITLSSLQQQLSFQHFGKSRLFGSDLYASLIAPGLRTSLYVETWIRGERISSSCKGIYKVYNVLNVKLSNKVFQETEDHSKWAVSTSSDQPFVCIGDINRMTSQFKRGGGSLCVSSLNIWTVFKELAADFEKCQ